MCTILKLGVCFLAISFSSGENVEVSLYPKKPHKFERLNCVDQMIITTARLVLSKSVNILKKKNTRCQPKQGRCQETLSIRQGKRHSTPYFTGYSQTCAIFFEKWSCVTFLLPSVSKKHYNRECWDLRCPMLPLLLEKGDFYLPNQWNHGKVPDYKSGSPTAVARGLGNLTWPYYLIYGGSRCLFNRNSGVWDNSNSMKAVCLQHDALPWEVVIINFDEESK